MNLTTLQTLIAAGESLTLELKKSTAEKDRACRSLCALANGQGRQFEPHKSKPWNPWIAKVFHRRGLIETWGRGTLKIASLMQAVGLPVPTLQERTESVLMTFYLPEHRVGVNVGVNGLLAYIQANPGQRAGEMAVTFTVTQRTIERWLKQHKENGLIEFRGAAKTGGYYCKNI